MDWAPAVDFFGVTSILNGWDYQSYNSSLDLMTRHFGVNVFRSVEQASQFVILS